MIEALTSALMNERLKNGRSGALKNVNCLSINRRLTSVAQSFYILA